MEIAMKVLNIFFFNMFFILVLYGVTYSQSPSDSVEVAWINHYSSGLLPAEDEATDMAVDGFGNVFVTGSSSNLPHGLDYLTIKYDPTGHEEWTVHFNAEGNGDDIPRSVSVDQTSNVYVTGRCFGASKSYDFATVKYNSSGVQQWVVYYNGPNNSDDYAEDMVIDNFGNIYVTGTSNGDLTTIKYSSDGIQQWIARYDGPANSDDEARDIALDDSGYVYITGIEVGQITSFGNLDFDYITIKYNSSGTEQWTAHYNSGSYDDSATSLAVDGSGNVYVTGQAKDDYTTVKYDQYGMEEWVVQYDEGYNDGARSITIDAIGNIYVTGASQDSTGRFEYHFVTISYYSSGEERWIARYSGPESGSVDGANCITVDTYGNVYVTGYSDGIKDGIGSSDYTTIKYDYYGNKQWVKIYNGPGNTLDHSISLTIDSNGNVYITGYSYGIDTDSDYATIKYSSSGVEEWVSRYNGMTNSNDRATDIALDSQGNIYVIGESRRESYNNNFIIVKYNSLGGQEWVAKYECAYSGTPTGFVVDNYGNVYVTGWEDTPGDQGHDYVTIKYNSSGEQQWVKMYNGSGNDNDNAFDIGVDNLGNVYVTGTSAGSWTGEDYVTIKYNSDGIQQWVARFDGGWRGSKYMGDNAHALFVDSLGYIYVTGSSRLDETLEDCVTIKYTPSGDTLWTARYKGIQDKSYDYGRDIAVDDQGNVFVTGSSNNIISEKFVTIKYNSSGGQEWVALCDSIDQSYPTSLIIDNSGYVYVTGYGVPLGSTTFDFITIKYDTSGITEWVACYDRPDNSDDQAPDMVIDDFGNVYVAGESNLEPFPDSNWDCTTIKYNSSGVKKWVASYNGPGNTDDGVGGIAIDKSGNVYVAGSSSGENWSIITVIKYIQIYSHVQYSNLQSPSQYKLTQNYPNPFNSITTLEYHVPNVNHVILKVYNTLGQETMTLVDETKEAGYYKVLWDATDKTSGVYFLRLQTFDVSKKQESYSEIRKVILLK